MRGLTTAALMAFGCAPTGGGGGGGSGGSGGAVDADMGATDAAVEADLGVRDAVEAFCDRAARAKCEWAFECVGGGQVFTKLGLSGPEVDDCAAADAEKCKADVLDRFDRETLNFAANAVDTCVAGLAGAPCPGGDPLEWVEQWRGNTLVRCGNVVRGTRADGDACTVRNDCADPTLICAIGTCRAGSRNDLMTPCNAEGALPGELNADGLCPGGWCSALGPNEEGLDGLCTIDCSDGRNRCPADGAQCLQISVQGQAPTWLCTADCTMDAHCSNDLPCRKIDAMDVAADASRHCWVTEEQ